MKSIILSNQKGGVGKSTIASNILTSLAKVKQYKVAGIDTDPQASLYNFLSARARREIGTFSNNNIAFQDSLLLTLEQKIKNYFLQKTDFVIIDTMGHADRNIINSFKLVDKIIVPMQPSPVDYEATTPLLKLFAQEKITKYKVLINCVPLNSTKNSKEIIEELKRNNIPCFDSTLGFRNIYREAFLLHQGICEYDTKKTNEFNAIKEFDIFMEEFLNWVK